MAIKLLQGFNITSTNPIDTRFVLTKEQMAAMNDKVMPNKYFALCSDDNQIYYYDKTSALLTATGKFRPIVAANDVVIVGYYLNNTFYTDSTYTVECEKSTKYVYVDKNTNGMLYTWDGVQYERSVKDASETVAGVMKLYVTGGQNEDGTMTQKSITNGVQSISFAVDEEDTECLVLDLPWD